MWFTLQISLLAAGLMIATVGELTCSFLTKGGNVYTSAAYGAPEVTVPVDMESSIVQIKLEAEKAAERD